MRKRTAALIFLLFVLTLVGATLGLLSTPRAGAELCVLVRRQVAARTGEPIRVASCTIRPFALEVELAGVELGPEGAPVVAVDRVSARLAPVQVMGGLVRLTELRVVNPRVRLTVSGKPRGGGCDREALRVVDVRRLDVEGGSLDLALPGGSRLEVGRLDVATRPAGALGGLPGPFRRARVDLRASGVHYRSAHRDVAGDLAVEGELALDLSGAELSRLEVEASGLKVAAWGRIGDLCAPTLDLTAHGEGEAAELFRVLEVHVPVDGRLKADGTVRGTLQAPEVSAAARLQAFRIGPFTAGDGSADVRVSADDVRLERLALDVGAGSIAGKLSIGFTRPVPLEGEAEFRNVELGDLLDRFRIPGAWVSAKLDGKARFTGPLEPTAVSATVSGEVRELRALTRSYGAGAADPGVLAFRRGRLEAPLRIDLDGLHFDGTRLEVGRGVVAVDGSAFFETARGFQLAMKGDVDLDALGRVGAIPWRGLAAVELEGGAAPYGNPRITGKVRATNFRFLDLDLGTGSADLVYDDFLLRLSRVEGIRGVTRWRGEGVVDLARSPAHVVSARYGARGRLRDLFEGVMDYVPSARTVRDVMDGDVEVSGTATGPADALDAEFEGTLGAGTLLGRPYDGGRAAGRVHRGREVRVDVAELRRREGASRLQGTVGIVPPFTWNLDGSFAGWRLEDLLPGEWTGSASGTARLEGSFEVPRIRMAASAAGAALSGLALGGLQAGGTVQGDRLVVTGSAEGLEFQGEARLSGRMPFQARAAVDVDDAARLVGAGSPAAVRVIVRGEATAQGELTELEQVRGRLRLERLEAGWADFRVAAAAPVVLESSRGRVDLAPLTLQGTNTALTLSGSRLAGGELDANASGEVDVRLLASLVPSLKRPHGRLRLEAQVGGTLASPTLVGSGRLDDAGFQVKGSNVTFSELHGDLAFSQNRVLFDGLEAAVNGGRARLEGEAELSRLAPTRLRVRADMEDVAIAVPAYLPATLSGRLELEGTLEAALLSGRIRAVRARYTEDVGIEKAVLELRRRPPPPPRPYDKAGEWLRLEVQIVADGDVRVENDLVRGPIRGELVLTGTLAAPGLLGTLSMAGGSRAVFRGNEFELSHAVFEFTGRNRFEMGLDAQGEAQVRDYQVFMSLSGTLQKPQLTLTSSPALSEPDIITLLSLGFTRRDAAAGDDMGAVATAAAAQALVSASGLDEQVRRFLPRGGLVRDLSVRVTSAYSEGTGQVEPRAEFESYLMKDRLRLRYQAPLGAARGQRAQAELRLGPRTALQYQWENDNPDIAAGDHGLDLKLRWEWADR